MEQPEEVKDGLFFFLRKVRTSSITSIYHNATYLLRVFTFFHSSKSQHPNWLCEGLSSVVERFHSMSIYSLWVNTSFIPLDFKRKRKKKQLLDLFRFAAMIKPSLIQTQQWRWISNGFGLRHTLLKQPSAGFQERSSSCHKFPFSYLGDADTNDDAELLSGCEKSYMAVAGLMPLPQSYKLRFSSCATESNSGALNNNSGRTGGTFWHESPVI